MIDILTETGFVMRAVKNIIAKEFTFFRVAHAAVSTP
jgi:uncharacterized membrane protein